MNLVSVRIITDDVRRLVGFYERVTGTAAAWATEDFAEITSPFGTLAIGSMATVAMFAEGSAHAAENRSVILEFLVEDVDAEYARLAEHLEDVVAEPTTLPWGNRSLLFRDPDGNLVNLFAPVAPQAVEKFARYSR